MSEPSPVDDPAAFPTLDGNQLATLDALGTRRSVAPGEYLYREGDATYDFFVVVSGAVDIVLRVDGEERVITRHGAGRFLGELNMLTGLRVFVSARVVEAGEVIVVPTADPANGAGDAAGARRHDPRRVHGTPGRAGQRRRSCDPRRRLAVLLPTRSASESSSPAPASRTSGSTPTTTVRSTDCCATPA